MRLGDLAIGAMLLPCALIFGQTPTPVLGLKSDPLVIPMYAPGYPGNGYTTGIPVLGPSNLVDNGSQLLYKGQPLSGGQSGLESFTVDNLEPIFTATLGPKPTTAPLLTFTLNSTGQSFVMIGPSDGPGVPSYRTLTAIDIPALPYQPLGSYPTFTTSTPNAIPMWGMTPGHLVDSGLTFVGNITAPAFIGALQGNASTATNVPYTGVTGPVPTWNQSTTGNAATATHASTADSATTATTATNLTGSITESQVTGLATDLAGKAGLAGNNTFTGGNTFSGSINAQGITAVGPVGVNSLTAVTVVSALYYKGNVRTITAADATPVGSGDTTVLCNATSGAIAEAIQASAKAETGTLFVFVKSDASANACTLTGATNSTGTTTINGATTLVLTQQYETAILQYEGAGGWSVLSHSSPSITPIITGRITVAANTDIGNVLL